MPLSTLGILMQVGLVFSSQAFGMNPFDPFLTQQTEEDFYETEGIKLY